MSLLEWTACWIFDAQKSDVLSVTDTLDGVTIFSVTLFDRWLNRVELLSIQKILIARDVTTKVCFFNRTSPMRTEARLITPRKESRLISGRKSSPTWQSARGKNRLFLSRGTIPVREIAIQQDRKPVDLGAKLFDELKP